MATLTKTGFRASLMCSLSNDWLLALRQINHDRVARFDKIFRRDHNLFTPFTCARAEDGLVKQTCLQERSEVRWLPAKGWDRADHISSCLFHSFRSGHLDVARTNGFFEIS